jgi:hypothetical protein
MAQMAGCGTAVYPKIRDATTAKWMYDLCIGQDGVPTATFSGSIHYSPFPTA